MATLADEQNDEVEQGCYLCDFITKLLPYWKETFFSSCNMHFIAQWHN